MSNKTGHTLNKFCRIYLWLERHSPKLAESIKDLCLEGVLSPNKNVNGITFLVPDQKVIEKIYSDTYETGGNADNAVKRILAHIIPDYYPDVNTFKKAHKIGTKLNIALPAVTSTSVNSVSFGETFTITAVSDFQPMSNKNLAIWKVTTGEVPTTGEKIVLPSKPKTKEKKVKGGNQPHLCGYTHKECLSTSFRAVFANFVEHKYIEHYISKIGVNKKDVYLFVTNKLLEELKKPENIDDFNKIKIILDENHIVTFYLLLEPYKAFKEFLISDEIFTQDFLEGLYKSINNGSVGDIPVETSKYTKIVYNDNDTDKLIEIKKTAVKYKFDLCDDANFFNLRNDILHIYAQLELENKVGLVNNVFHECLYKHYKTDNNKFKRLWQDELRFIIKEKLRLMNVEFEHNIKISAFNNLCNILKLHFPGNEYTCELQIMNECDYKLSICIRDKLLTIKHFLQSPNFLYVITIPLPQSDKGYTPEAPVHPVTNDRNQHPVHPVTNDRNQHPVHPGTNDHSQHPVQPGTNDYSQYPVQPGTNDHNQHPVHPVTNDYSQYSVQPGTNDYSQYPVQPGTNDYSQYSVQPGTNDYSQYSVQPGTNKNIHFYEYEVNDDGTSVKKSHPLFSNNHIADRNSIEYIIEQDVN